MNRLNSNDELLCFSTPAEVYGNRRKSQQLLSPVVKPADSVQAAKSRPTSYISPQSTARNDGAIEPEMVKQRPQSYYLSPNQTSSPSYGKQNSSRLSSSSMPQQMNLHQQQSQQGFNQPHKQHQSMNFGQSQNEQFNQPQQGQFNQQQGQFNQYLQGQFNQPQQGQFNQHQQSQSTEPQQSQFNQHQQGQFNQPQQGQFNQQQQGQFNQPQQGQTSQPQQARPTVNENQNGKASSKEMLLNLFNRFDSDNSGRLTADELAHALKNYDSTRFRESMVIKMVKAYDTQGLGSVNFQQFVNILNYINNWRRIFEMFDGDNNLHIDRREFVNALAYIGYKIDSTCLERIFDKFCEQSPDHGKIMKLDAFIESSYFLLSISEDFKKFPSNDNGFSANVPFTSYIDLFLKYL